jgi:hypothetical protein
VSEPGSMEGSGAGGGSVLVPERQSLFAYVGCSVLFHVVAVVGAWGTTAGIAVMSALLPMCHTPTPKISDAIEVSMVSLPKSKLDVPDRAQRVKRATGEVPSPVPPPIKQSDLKFETDKPKPDAGNADEAARQQLMEEMERERLLEDMMAAEGAVDRDATDPDGEENAARLAGIGAGAKGDPEFQRWVGQVQQILMAQFKPLGAASQDRPDLKCLVDIKMDPTTGEITSYEVSGPSGVFSFDQAAERAVQAVPSLPLPPEKYLPLLEEGVGFRFTPPR